VGRAAVAAMTGDEDILKGMSQYHSELRLVLMTPLETLTPKRRELLRQGIATEVEWDPTAADYYRRVTDALDRLPDGQLEVRPNYGEVPESELTDAELVDLALDFFGIVGSIGLG
jgi:hypothetical protein